MSVLIQKAVECSESSFWKKVFDLSFHKHYKFAHIENEGFTENTLVFDMTPQDRSETDWKWL